MGARLDDLGDQIDQVQAAVRNMGVDMGEENAEHAMTGGWTRAQWDSHGKLVEPEQPKDPEVEAWEERWHRRA